MLQGTLENLPCQSGCKITTLEPVGLKIGIAGLAGAFTACVDCFEYIQLGRQFGQDYGNCLLKLDVAKLRLSRWGVAMGLGPELTSQATNFCI